MSKTTATPAAGPVAIKIDAGLKERVKRLAEARDRTPHWVMHEAIKQYVAREEKRETLRGDALSAWDHYELTGLHVTLEEADAWLAKLEAGQDLEPPESHV